jgi:DNA invertase Pin-like site-specific DNA recombinase
MSAAVYARVSTANNGQSPEMQLRELREYCQHRGWDVAGEYVDAISGSKEKRPELDRLMVDAHRRRFDAVVFGSSIALPGQSPICSGPSRRSARLALSS